MCTLIAGSDYIEKIQNNLNNTVLQATLILTITLTFYISLPEFNRENNATAFSALVGFSAFVHLICIILSIIFSAVLYMGSADVDALILRVRFHWFFVATTATNYLALLTTMASMLIAGFDRSNVDGGVQLYCFVLILMAVIAFKVMVGKGERQQDKRCLAFYKKYCDPNGELKDEYLQMIYGTDVESGSKKQASFMQYELNPTKHMTE